MLLERGGVLGSYRLLFRLGSGGMGEVWKARDTRHDRDVAVKVLSPDAVRDPDRMKRFAMEARATSALDHPNILAVYEVGESDAGPYIVTEFVDGDTVRALLNEGPLPLRRALVVAAQAAAGVGSAHDSGFVHRDIKPENLMVDRSGTVKILDFGLAKLLRPGEASGDLALGGRTATGMVVGTAGYLSPEQLKGGKASERSDVFSLGVVLYEMATGSNPFQRNNAVETFSAILRDPPEPLHERIPGAPVELSRVIDRAVAKDAGARYASARELAADLRAVLDLLPGSADEADDSERPFDPAIRRMGWGFFAGIGGLLLAVVLVAAFVALRGC